MDLDAQEYTASDSNGDENSVEGTEEECCMSTPYSVPMYAQIEQPHCYRLSLLSH